MPSITPPPTLAACSSTKSIKNTEVDQGVDGETNAERGGQHWAKLQVRVKSQTQVAPPS